MKKIVVADDDQQILEAVALVLAESGYQVIAVEDPTQVVKQIKAQHPHLVLLDLYISGLDGRQIITELRQDGTLEDVPIILMSADSNLSDSKTQADAILKKPFDITELEDLVGECLQSAHD